MSQEEIQSQSIDLPQRMVREPFWLGLITVLVVMIIIGVAYLVKKHLPEKIEKLMRTDLEANMLSGGQSYDHSGHSGNTGYQREYLLQQRKSHTLVYCKSLFFCWEKK